MLENPIFYINCTTTKHPLPLSLKPKFKVVICMYVYMYVCMYVCMYVVVSQWCIIYKEKKKISGNLGNLITSTTSCTLPKLG